MKDEGRRRVVIEHVSPCIDGGRFPAKRAVGERLRVRADILVDGHDEITAVLLYRRDTDPDFSEAPMRPLGNDGWEASFPVRDMAPHRYTVEAWVDRFASWRAFLEKKLAAGQDVDVELAMGAALAEEAAGRARGPDKKRLLALAGDLAVNPETALEPELAELMARYPDRSLATRFETELRLETDPPKALFSAWYEMFPRAAAMDADRHGRFRDMEALLPEIARMGFDVLYLPPIHPVGLTHRKGPNNSPACEPGDPGSPWAIGSPEGGHTAVHPGLGSLEDFRRLLKKAGEQGIDIALDMAFQCSPDHPWVREHPEWFRHRPDGTIQYAENPPKKYQDVFPLDFECARWRELWEELRDVFLFWAGQGVRFFRVDNPHTKPLAFWEWVIAQVKTRYPEAVFLAEAFTRPKIMYRLAKAGFTQSYTYFTWRNTKQEIIRYMTELVEEAPREYFRPNFWPNTPDILPEYLQYGGRAGFMVRLILAATLSSSYGIYGPAFELCESEALPGSEEYKDSEKYQLKTRDWDREGNLKDFLALVNRIRRENRALQTTWNIVFLETENDFVLFYAKYDDDKDNIILTAVNLDPYNTQTAWLHLPESLFGIREGEPYMVHDLLGDDKFIWYGGRNAMEFNPHVLPARIFRLKKRLRRETDFDYFM